MFGSQAPDPGSQTVLCQAPGIPVKSLQGIVQGEQSSGGWSLLIPVCISAALLLAFTFFSVGVAYTICFTKVCCKYFSGEVWRPLYETLDRTCLWYQHALGSFDGFELGSNQAKSFEAFHESEL